MAVVAEDLKTERSHVDRFPSTLDSHWLVLARHAIAPTGRRLGQIRRRMDKLAVTVGGRHDGWEAEMQRDSVR
jgi:hypothetical protein